MRALDRVVAIPDGSINPNPIDQQMNVVMLSVGVPGNQELVLVVDAHFPQEVAGDFRPFFVGQLLGRRQRNRDVQNRLGAVRA